ncbi:helix-turn-helix domain-containing protein [Nocardioides donggukensis]|uniref:Helix-turn-helix domain-containing protein n=1 Tax=Nocardioides donggukensis TaxID=2774019 RepID=A0A927K762_9ACTN|nr:helix-turn-helix domain-containing protein [Nocardioides donggukensis]MBD8870410.1 helix-turn-helix domain-containing protein [Nocardioides donggukensis]
MTSQLRGWRQGLGLTAPELARRVGVSPNTVGRWERGECLPQADRLPALAGALRRQPRELLRVLGEPEAEARGHRGHGLRRLRLERGRSGAEIAAAVGVPTHTVYNWERGGARIPEAHLEDLAAALGLSSAELASALAEARVVVEGLRARPVGRLARLRIGVGLSQSAAADRLGFGRSSLRAYERGRPAPLAHLRRMAVLYRVTVAEVAHACGARCPRELDPTSWRAGDLSRALRVLREWSGLTQAEVAMRVGASKDSVRAWENARTQPGPFLRVRLEELYRLRSGSLIPAYARPASTGLSPEGRLSSAPRAG